MSGLAAPQQWLNLWPSGPICVRARYYVKQRLVRNIDIKTCLMCAVSISVWPEEAVLLEFQRFIVWNFFD